MVAIEDVWVSLTVVLCFVVVAQLAWGVYREIHFASTIEKFGSGVSSLPPTVAVVERSLEKIAEQVDRQCTDEKERTQELRESVRETQRLVIDVERRISDLIRDAGRGGQTFKFDQSRTDISGGTNQNQFGKDGKQYGG